MIINKYDKQIMYRMLRVIVVMEKSTNRAALGVQEHGESMTLNK